MNISTRTQTMVPAKVTNSHNPASPPKQECSSCQPQDMMVIGEEKPSPQKEEIIRSMLRRSPDQEAVCDVVEALSAYPVEALERVAEFGTKLEVYDEDAGDEFPNYMPTLAHPQVVGAYNTVANVLGIEEDNLSPFVLLHEFAHALDASMGNVSETPRWQGAHKLAKSTNQVVRDYAKHDPSEYLAENTSAYLVSDEALYPLVEEGLKEGIATDGLTEREYYRLHQNYSNDRLEKVDPQGFKMVEQLLDSVSELPKVDSKPAMDEAQFQVFLDSRKAS